MEFEAIGPRAGFVAVFTKQYLIPIVMASCALFSLRYFTGWLRRYLLLKKIPGPDDTFPPSFLYKALRARLFTTQAKDVTAEFATMLREVVETYPDPEEGICKVYLGFTPVVLLSNPHSAEVILTDNVNISKPIMYGFLDKYITQSLLTSTGDFWRFQRKLLTPAFHFKILDDFMEIFNKHAAKFVHHLGKWPPQEEIRLLRETSKCTINVIGETSLGHDVNAMAGENYYGRALSVLQTLILIRTIRPWMWIDSIYYKFTHEGTIAEHAIKAMRGLSGRILKEKLAEREGETRKKPEQNGNATSALPAKKKIRTFIEIMLDTHSKHPDMLSKHWVQCGVDTMLFAGQDTTATSASWMMYLLGHHPEVQEKCREELFRVLGPDPSTPVTSEHLKTLKYLDAMVKESMRIYPPIPLIGRQLDTDVRVKGNGKVYTLPAGTQVFTSIFHVHRDKRYFPDPEKFDPERFLDENAPHKSHPFSYVPFSGGPRNCIGQKFALMEVKVIMAHILRYYKWTSTTPREKIKLCFEIVLRAKGDLRIRMEPLRLAENGKIVS